MKTSTIVIIVISVIFFVLMSIISVVVYLLLAESSLDEHKRKALEQVQLLQDIIYLNIKYKLLQYRIHIYTNSLQHNIVV